MVIENVTENATIITVTDKAAAKAKSILADKGVENGALRVFVVGGGCWSLDRLIAGRRLRR